MGESTSWTGLYGFATKPLRVLAHSGNDPFRGSFAAASALNPAALCIGRAREPVTPAAKHGLGAKELSPPQHPPPPPSSCEGERRGMLQDGGESPFIAVLR